MRLLRVLTLSVCPLLAFGQAAEQDWRFAHPGATLVGGIRVDALLQSPILNKVIEQATAKDQATAMGVAMVRGVLSGVSEVRFSILDVGAGKDPEVLTLITGRMDDAALTALAKGKATVHRVDANTLLVGEGSSVEDAIRRLSEPPVAIHNRGVLRGKALGEYDLWIAGTLPAMPITAALSEMVHGLALGFSLRDDFRLEVAIDTASAEMAEELIRKVREAQREQPAAAGAKLLTDVDGTTARFRVTVEKSVIDQAIQEAMANGKIGSPASGLFGAATPAPAPKFKEKEPARKTIVIYGLDDGTREIDPSKAR
jgi:hypothetical protein